MSSPALRRTLIAAAAVVTLALVGCSPAGIVAGDTLSARTSTSSPSPSPDADAILTFADGATLSEDSGIGWGDGLAQDTGWIKDASKSKPGLFAYNNAADTCTATFQLFELGSMAEISGMDDRQASDELMWQVLDPTSSGPAARGFDGRFLLNESGASFVESRQASITIDRIGVFSAARAFVEANRGVSVLVSCEGADITQISHEVLSKNVIVIHTP